MGSSSSSDRREQRREARQQPQQQTQQQQRAPPPQQQQPSMITQSRTTQNRGAQQQYPPMPNHLLQHQQPAYQNSYQRAQYNNQPGGLQRQESERGPEVKDGEKLINCATVDRTRVHYIPDSQTLTFEITSTVPVTYEVHAAIRQTVTKGEIVYSPNKPKNPPTPIYIDRPVEAEPCAAQIDLHEVSHQEQTFVQTYPRQIPVSIVLKYKTPEGREQEEHTHLAIAPKCEVVKQLIVAGGHVYLVEHLFGAEQGAEPTVAEVAGGGEGLIDDSDDDLCVICLTEKKNTAVMPCRHMCLCKGCAEELKKHSPKCPVCRGPISQLLTMGS